MWMSERKAQSRLIFSLCKCSITLTQNNVLVPNWGFGSSSDGSGPRNILSLYAYVCITPPVSAQHQPSQLDVSSFHNIHCQQVFVIHFLLCIIWDLFVHTSHFLGSNHILFHLFIFALAAKRSRVRISTCKSFVIRHAQTLLSSRSFMGLLLARFLPVKRRAFSARNFVRHSQALQ